MNPLYYHQETFDDYCRALLNLLGYFNLRATDIIEKYCKDEDFKFTFALLENFMQAYQMGIMCHNGWFFHFIENFYYIVQKLNKNPKKYMIEALQHYSDKGTDWLGKIGLLICDFCKFLTETQEEMNEKVNPFLKEIKKAQQIREENDDASGCSKTDD